MNNVKIPFPILTIYLSSAEKRPPYFSFLVSQLHSLIHRDLSEVEKRKWKNDIKKIDWGRDDKIFRHIEDHLHRHLQLVAKATKDFSKSKDIRFVIVGGHAQMIPKIKKHLPYPLDKMVRGQFITELNIPLSEVLRHSKKIASQISI